MAAILAYTGDQDQYTAVTQHARRYASITTAAASLDFNARFFAGGVVGAQTRSESAASAAAAAAGSEATAAAASAAALVDAGGAYAPSSAARNLRLDVVDAVVRKEALWHLGAGNPLNFGGGLLKKEYVEYVVKLWRADDEASGVVIVHKRFSELAALHDALRERRAVAAASPQFPDKHAFGSSDPASDFVTRRRAALRDYLAALFGTNPWLRHDAEVVAFFGLAEVDRLLMLEASSKRVRLEAEASAARSLGALQR